MFGTLKPHTCRLGCDRKHEYASFYCGLCKSLGDHFGTLSRALLNYDAVFLALVADGLMEVEAAPDRCRCPMLPLVHRPTVRPDSAAMRYAAAMQMLLSDQWLADRASDGRRAARAARPLLSGKVEAARAILADLGISLADLEGFEDRQARCEVPGETGPREAAAPTASALERVFERMAKLPGVAAAAATGEGSASLGAFGLRLGRVIYLIDALDDLEKDHASGAFNPCLVRSRAGMRVGWQRVELTWSLLHDDLAALGDLAAQLPFRRHRELVAQVVSVELPAKARAAAKRAHAFARAEDERARRRHAWPVRMLAAAATAFVFLWVWLSSMPFARAATKRTRDAGAPDAAADAGSAPPRWDPRLPSFPAGTASAPRPAPSSAPKPDDTGGKDPKAPGTPPSGTATPGGTGGGCGNPCSGCGSGGNPCKGACDSCDACKGCEPGSCCKPCDSCSSCCSSCNSCGSCCK